MCCGKARHAQGFGDSARPGDVGLQNRECPVGDKRSCLVERVVALARGKRHLASPAERAVAILVLGAQRLLEPRVAVSGEGLPYGNRAVEVVGPVRIRGQFDPIPDSRADALDPAAGRNDRCADLDLEAGEAAADEIDGVNRIALSDSVGLHSPA